MVPRFAPNPVDWGPSKQALVGQQAPLVVYCVTSCGDLLGQLTSWLVNWRYAIGAWGRRAVGTVENKSKACYV